MKNEERLLKEKKEKNALRSKPLRERTEAARAATARLGSGKDSLGSACEASGASRAPSRPLFPRYPRIRRREPKGKIARLHHCHLPASSHLPPAGTRCHRQLPSHQPGRVPTNLPAPLKRVGEKRGEHARRRDFPSDLGALTLIIFYQ